MFDITPIESIPDAKDAYLPEAREAIKALDKVPTKAATIKLGKDSEAAEYAALRDAAREAGYTLRKVKHVERAESEDSVTFGVRLAPKVERQPGLTRNRKKSDDDAAPKGK